MDVIKLFYNDIVKEASQGKIDCFFHSNVIFNTYLVEKNVYVKSKCDKDILIPTLIIKNQKLFDELLLQYVSLAKEFYINTIFDDKLLNQVFCLNTDKGCKEKLILANIWLNAGTEDFNNPIEFLKKRISFLKSNLEPQCQNYGYSNILKSNLSLEMNFDDINLETPYKLSCSLKNDNNKYNFPEIKFGIYNECVYIYAIQNNEQPSNEFTKTVKRLLYKVNDGFDATKDNSEIYEEGNLKDITASFLVALNIAITYFHNLGFRKIIVSNYLVSRWNANTLAINRADISDLERASYINKQEEIEKNVVEKCLRTFLRLVYHYDGINVESYPFELDDNLILVLNEKITSNNKLLNETAKLIRKKNL